MTVVQVVMYSVRIVVNITKPNHAYVLSSVTLIASDCVFFLHLYECSLHIEWRQVLDSLETLIVT